MAGNLIIFNEVPKKGLNAESYQEICQILVEMDCIIKAALDVPEGEYEPFLSAICGFEDIAIGVIQISKTKK